MYKILIIEDDIEVIDNIKELLEIYDYEVLGAVSGQQGIDLAKKKNPDLIICDIMMPDTDGYEVLKALRDDKLFNTVPFLYLSAKASMQDMRRGMDLGADDYITKPYKSTELINAIQSRLKKAQALKKTYENEINEIRDSISYSLPNEFRTPLNDILSFADVLKSDLSGYSREEIIGMLSNIHDSGKNLNKMIENYLFLCSVDKSENHNDGTEVKFPETKTLILEKVLFIADLYKRTRDITFEMENAPLECNPEYISKIAEQLTDNAMKFSATNSEVKVSSAVVQGKYRLSFLNTGRGFAEDTIKKIGEFSQLNKMTLNQQGVGMGLAIVKKIIDCNGGELTINSIPDETTEVVVILPIRK